MSAKKEFSKFKDNGYSLLQDLEQVTQIYQKMNPDREDMALIASAASVTYILFVHRNILKTMREEADRISAIESLKYLICQALDKLLKEVK